MIEALSHPFFQRALLAGLLASVACGIVGTWVVVKRIASISGGLSHAAFGGVGLGHLLGFEPLLGATGFALLSGAGVGAAYQKRLSGLDTLIAMVWAVGMALGIVFISWTPGYAPDLMSYLFGSILYVPERFLYVVAGLDVLVVGTTLLLYKEFRAVTFDEQFSRVMGVPVVLVFQILLALVSLVVVVLIRVVGVILVIALLTMPAAIARHWTHALRSTMLLAIAVAAGCTVLGLFLSYALDASWGLRTPAGPLIILLTAILYGISALVQREPGGRGREA